MSRCITSSWVCQSSILQSLIFYYGCFDPVLSPGEHKADEIEIDGILKASQYLWPSIFDLPHSKSKNIYILCVFFIGFKKILTTQQQDRNQQQTSQQQQNIKNTKAEEQQNNITNVTWQEQNNNNKRKRKTTRTTKTANK